jgi:hypothetical protein
MVLFQGDILEGDPCTNVESKRIIDPALPSGATIPPLSTNLVIVSLFIVHKG